MFRRFIAAIFVCAGISCNNNSTPSSADVDSTTDADHTSVNKTLSDTNQTDTLSSKKDTTKTVFADLADWEISEQDFNRMSQAQCPFSTPDECNLRNHKKYKKALRLIEAHYPPLDWNYVYIPARFEEVDVERYKKTRKRRNPNNEKIQGHATLLLEVSPKDKTLTSVLHYFDICIICPPPNTGTCDLDDPLPLNPKK
jgi:hypothetical protein